MRIRVSVPENQIDPYVLDPIAEAVTRLDEAMIRSGQSPTSHELIAKGAVWRPEPPGDEHFDHGGTIASRGWGDCDDWAPLHCATLRATGVDPGCKVEILPSGPNTYHATVRRSDGRLDDPSVMAGMKPCSVVGQGGEMMAAVYDPHDGRVYRGQLLPTVAPMSPHLGPTMNVRGCSLASGPYFEGRVDVPIAGSPLFAMKGRARRHHGHGRVRGVVPYAIACIGHGYSPAEALDSALMGAIMIGDAAELDTSLDRYKLLAMQLGLRGLSPGQVRDALVHQITLDVQAKSRATGTHPMDHTTALMTELHAVHGAIAPRVLVGDLFSDIGNLASGVVASVSSAVSSVAKAVSAVPWGELLHDAQAAVSLVPGLGTAVSDVVAAAETAYESAAALLHGDPIGAALDAAYNFALASVPGADALRPVLDPVKTTLTDLAGKKEPIETALLDGILSAVPDSPNFGGLSPRSIASSLAHVLVDKLGAKNTGTAKNPKPGAATKPPMATAPAKGLPGAPRPPGGAPPKKAPRPPGSVRRPPAPPTRTPLSLAPPRGVMHAGVDVAAPPMSAAHRGESVVGGVAVVGRWYYLDHARGVWRWKGL